MKTVSRHSEDEEGCDLRVFVGCTAARAVKVKNASDLTSVAAGPTLWDEGDS